MEFQFPGFLFKHAAWKLHHFQAFWSWIYAPLECDTFLYGSYQENKRRMNYTNKGIIKNSASSLHQYRRGKANALW